MKLTNSKLFQEGDCWWYRHKNGTRQRGYVRSCTTCGDEYVALKNREATHCSEACYKKECKRCSKEFAPKKSQRQVYCSEICRLGTAVCEECGANFQVTKNSARKFCSKECFYEQQVPTGTVRVDSDTGYLLVKVPKDTPGTKRSQQTQTRWMFHHRYVMQLHLGRPLLKKERVHHKNGIKTDNKLDNLELTYCSGTGKDKHVPGQRIDDLIAYLVVYHTEKLKDAFKQGPL